LSDRAAILSACTLALVKIDDLSTTRYVHVTSLRETGHSWASDAELDAFIVFMNSTAYSAEIETAIRGGRFLGAWIDRRLVGTAGWMPVVEGSPVARIRWCHVLPMFARMGIGHRLLMEVEAAAEATGHTSLVARTPPSATPFFERSGYGITSYGTRAVPPGTRLPVAFLRKNLRPPAHTALL
jgi:GNAT superfamily N-acetyltransferase